MAKRSREDSPSSSSDLELLTAQRATSGQPSREASVEPRFKYPHLDPSSDHEQVIMRCHLPPHRPLSFTSYDDYDVHYHKFHVNRCSECQKNFPTEHYLQLHIAENHDPLNEVRRSRGEKTYGCLVEGCDRVCSTPLTRKRHMIDKHQFPKFYDFFIVMDGIDKRSSMLRPSHRRRSSASTNPTQTPLLSGHPADSTPVPLMNSDQTPVVSISKPSDIAMDDITKSMSSLKFVPPSVRFGRGGGHGGFARR
ncbi:hypothetical protein EJ06DRAFT_517130 [Trichodelitschia bisporula]|uniref:C2H2-type domain-containing protein n=1 Tax=Trichodelitschia bisporula TaxID=703511 RepID=A0A6G1HIX4_9PEZI|nr:hypothetical protein EJ06DRAFT_517130 [Trichodelitschia bisporula]